VSVRQRSGEGGAAGRGPGAPDHGTVAPEQGSQEPFEHDLPGLDTEVIEEQRLAPLADKRRVALIVVGFVVFAVAVYVLLPEVVGLEDALQRFEQGVWYWLLVALAFTVAGFAAFGALFRGIFAGSGDTELHRRLDVRTSYQITIAAFAASKIFSAGGAGGIALMYWALRRAGMTRRRAACRMVAFNAVLYSVYLLALVLFGVLLRSDVLSGRHPFAGTVVPAIIAAIVLAVVGLVALIPGDVERRLRDLSRSGRGRRSARIAARLATGPAVLATGVRTAIDYLRNPKQGALAIAGAIGFWAANIGTLWAAFEAFGGDVPLGVLVQGFFVGMLANLIPSPAGGIGSLDAGMIAAFFLFGVPGDLVFPAVLVYRVMAFWLPIPPGVVAYFQLRRTVAEWRDGQGRYTIQSEVRMEAT
jgi:uncharacterized protein (TIRG00374 family)